MAKTFNFLFRIVVYRLYGYRDAITIENISLDEIKSIEQFVKSEVLDHINRSFDPPLDETELIHFFGGQFSKQTSAFKFMPGEVKLISAIGKSVAESVSIHGLAYFNCNEESRYVADYFKLVNIAKEEKDNNIKLAKDWKIELFKKTLATVERYKSDKYTVEVTENMVMVQNKGNKLVGDIVCCFCKHDKVHHTSRVQLNTEKNSKWWALANFAKHLTDFHKFTNPNISKNVNSKEVQQQIRKNKNSNKKSSSKRKINKEPSCRRSSRVKKVKTDIEPDFDAENDTYVN